MSRGFSELIQSIEKVQPLAQRSLGEALVGDEAALTNSIELWRTLCCNFARGL